MSGMRLVAAGVVALLLGCGGDPVTPPGPAVATVVITDPLPSLFADDTLLLRAYARDTEDDSVTGRTFTWASGDESIATVIDGVVTGIAPGLATLTATLDTASVSVVVAVLARPARPLTHVAYQADSTSPALRVLRYATLDGTVVGSISEFGANITDYIWSPTGDRVLMKVGTHGWAVADHDGANFEMIPNLRVYPNDLSMPRWSPDGTRLVLARAALDVSLGSIQIRDMATGAYSPVTFVEALVFSPDMSPDGRRIVFHRPNPSAYGNELVVVRADGSDLRRVRIPDDGVAVQRPKWSPDGKLIAYHDFDGVVVISPDGLFVQRLTPACRQAASCGERDPEWSPDGTRIAFVRDAIGQPHRLVVRSLVDGSEISVSLGTGCCNITGLSWSPDGEWIATTERAPDYRAVVMRSDLTEMRPLNQTSGTIAPRFRP